MSSPCRWTSSATRCTPFPPSPPRSPPAADQPRQRGHQVADPLAAPAIRPNYLSTDVDRRIAAASPAAHAGIARQSALADTSPRISAGARFESDEELTRATGDIGTTIFHPVGTCKMGPDSDPLAVVDARYAYAA